MIKKVSAGSRRFCDKIAGVFRKRPLMFTICLAIAITLATEILGRHSLWRPFLFMGLTPVRFLVNVCIIFFTLSFGFLVPKRAFFISRMRRTSTMHLKARIWRALPLDVQTSLSVIKSCSRNLWVPGSSSMPPTTMKAKLTSSRLKIRLTKRALLRSLRRSCPIRQELSMQSCSAAH